MGYYDSNGKMTIDEVAAQKDVKRLEAAIERLENSKNALTSLDREASNMEGEVINAIVEKSGELEKRLQKMIDKMNATIYFINNTVKHYQKVDQDIRDSIKTSQDIVLPTIKGVNKVSLYGGSNGNGRH